MRIYEIPGTDEVIIDGIRVGYLVEEGNKVEELQLWI